MTYVIQFKAGDDVKKNAGDVVDNKDPILLVGIDRYVVEYLYAPNALASDEKPIVVMKFKDFLKQR